MYDDQKVILSFIIPALNEEKQIGAVIDSIYKNSKGGYPFEIIVVDNGSTDQTVAIARDKSALVLHKPGLTIGAMRNAGVSHGKGEIIVFIDSDVYLCDSWGKNIGQVIDQFEQDPMIISGSTCGVKNDASIIEKHWFDPSLRRRTRNYINSGHLIVKRATFERIGGFSNELETGEDVDFCQKARDMGVKIINNPMLEVVHEGYPKTVKEFFCRERWHGRGDYFSVKYFLSSKPALLSVAQGVVLITSIILAVWTRNILFLLCYVFFISLLCVSSAAYRFKTLGRSFWGGTILYSVYFMARTVALLDVILKGKQKISQNDN